MTVYANVITVAVLAPCRQMSAGSFFAIRTERLLRQRGQLRQRTLCTRFIRSVWKPSAVSVARDFRLRTAVRRPFT
jgi:hypothetical protein